MTFAYHQHKMRVVVDTNLWVSYLIQPSSPIASHLDKVIAQHTLLYSYATLLEVADVLTRPKFAKYIDTDDVRSFVMEFINIGKEVNIDVTITECRDPKDDKFLELAVCGQADTIITGDTDLLALHPFRGIPIVKAADFIL